MIESEMEIFLRHDECHEDCEHPCEIMRKLHDEVIEHISTLRTEGGLYKKALQDIIDLDWEKGHGVGTAKDIAINAVSGRQND